MSLVEGNGGNDMVMPVSPMYGGGGSGFGGWGGDNGWWIILLFLFALGGWGNGFGGGYGGGAMPYIMNNSTNADVQRGFDQQAVMSGISGVQSGLSGISTQLCNGFGDVQQSLCNGFAGVNATVTNGFFNAETAATARQMANMNQAFNAQTSMMQGFNNIQSQFADCCCENRLANCQTQNIIQNEANATRFADANNTRDLLTAVNAGVQSLKDQLCDYRNEQKDDIIAQLRSELMYARGQASQDVQTANIQAGQRALANEVEQYVVPRPIPAYTVQNPNCCTQNFGGCGCGM